MKKRMGALLLALALLAALLPGIAAPAYAAELSGYMGTDKCGTWTYNEGTKTLTVRGEELYGEFNFEDGTYAGSFLRASTEKAVVEEGTVRIASLLEQFSALKEVVLPKTLRYIGVLSFAYCTSLEELRIPAGVELIGDDLVYTGSENLHGTFEGCAALKHVWVDPANTHYSSDAYGVVFNKDKTSLKYCPFGLAGYYTVPKTVKKIEDNAFFNADKIVKVSLPEGLTEIGEMGYDALSGANLVSVTLPKTLKTVGVESFIATKLTEVTIPASATKIGSGAFALCDELRVVTILNKSCEIGPKIYEHDTLGDPKLVTVVGYPGSTAEAYANEYGHTFVSLTDQSWRNPFRDVNAKSWYYNSVKFVCQTGLFQGMDATHFKPGATMTRGMFATVLYRLAGSPAFSGGASFRDVKQDAYYAKAVGWAQSNGLINGIGGGLFGPNRPITRQEIVTLLYRYAKFANLDTQAEDAFTALDGAFTDEKAVSAFAREAFNWALDRALIQGLPNGGGRMELNLAPKANATRAEVAKLIATFARSYQLDR